jgi:hypothetical protein
LAVSAQGGEAARHGTGRAAPVTIVVDPSAASNSVAFYDARCKTVFRTLAEQNKSMQKGRELSFFRAAWVPVDHRGQRHYI